MNQKRLEHNGNVSKNQSEIYYKVKKQLDNLQSSNEEISQRAADSGLTVPALSSYSLRNSKPGLILGYAAFWEEEIQGGFAVLRASCRYDPSRKNHDFV